ncbi:hypothetical protein IMY05_018G0104000 [Salix suchowensis]|nr:hypothetical protein IMY05_018G0104000 [Salix suchowensis]
MRSHLLEKPGRVRNNGENSTGVLYLMAKASSLNVIPQNKLERLSVAETAYQRFFLFFRKKKSLSASTFSFSITR